MKKQISALMSTVTVIGSIYIPVAPVFSMENEQFNEIVAKQEQIKEGILSENTIQDVLSEDLNQQVVELDPILKKAINKQLNREYDVDVTKQDLESLTKLDWYPSMEGGSKISSLEGLEYAVNLTYLDLLGNEVSNLEPLSNLKNLEMLSLVKNNITDISALASLTNLKILGLSYNEISDIKPLSNMSALTHLSLNDNTISDITPLATLTNLEGLELSYNKISELKSLANLNRLEELRLDHNQISNLDSLPQLTKLKFLDLSNNQIIDITRLGDLDGLPCLVLVNNMINDLTPLDRLPYLETLDVNDQEIELNTVYIKKGATVVINNPLVGEWWSMISPGSGKTIYDDGFNVENGYYDSESNQFIWENVTSDSLNFSFSNYGSIEWGRKYGGWIKGTVTIPVEFYSIPEEFEQFIESDTFIIISGTGELDKPLVLEITQGTEKEEIEKLFGYYSDYKLTVTKKGTRSSLETYELIFTKGDEKVYFELKVHASDQDIITYLNNKISETNPPAGEGTNPPAGEGTNPPAGEGTNPPAGEGTNPPAGEGTNPPAGEGTNPPAGEGTNPPAENFNNSSQYPNTGFTGLIGLTGLGTFSLGIVCLNRKKK